MKKRSYNINEKICVPLACAMLVSALTACAANPTQEVVRSKNDGSFDVNVVRSVSHPTGETGTAAETKENLFRYEDDFTSTDGSVAFHMDIQENCADQAMPVVQVAPHFFTVEDAERIAHILFGERDYYEAAPLCAPVYSKSEIQNRIADGLLTPETREWGWGTTAKSVPYSLKNTPSCWKSPQKKIPILPASGHFKNPPVI